MKKSSLLLLFASIFTVVLIFMGCSDSKKQGTEGQSKKSAGQMEATTNWPHDRMTLVLPFDAGGSLDRMMRTLAHHLEKELDSKITVDNRPGATTQVGTTLFLNSADNGSNIFGGTQLYLSATIALQDADYNIDDIAMINIEQFDPATITVHKDSPYETLEDLIEAAKENPGKISYATVHGGPLHLTGVLLEEKLGIKFNPVFYDGGGPMRNALLGQQVDFMVGNAHGDSAIADQVRVLAVASEETMSIWPDALPINEELKAYNVDIPYVGSARFLAVQASFKEKHPELFQQLVEAYKNIYHSKEYQAFIKESEAEEVSQYRGPDESDELNAYLHSLMMEYKNQLSSK